MEFRTIERVTRVTFGLYPSPDQHTNHYQLGFNAEDVHFDLYGKKQTKLDYFDYMIKLLGGEKNIKAVDYKEETGYWQITLKNVMNMHRAKEALEQIETLEPYTDPKTKKKEERNYFLFREPLMGECRLWANLLQGENEGIVVLKTQKDFSELMAQFRDFKNGTLEKDNEIE